MGCWAHCRRNFFEAAVCKYEVGVEGLNRIREIYALEDTLKGLAPIDRKRERERLLGPLFDGFFSRSLTRGAPRRVGRSRRRRSAMRSIRRPSSVACSADGRLALDNTRSERSLKTIVVGRKNWMFYGSDVHAKAAAALFSLLASCKLHRIEPIEYLDVVLRVLPV